MLSSRVSDQLRGLCICSSEPSGEHMIPSQSGRKRMKGRIFWTFLEVIKVFDGFFEICNALMTCLPMA